MGGNPSFFLCLFILQVFLFSKKNENEEKKKGNTKTKKKDGPKKKNQSPHQSLFFQ